MLRQITPKTKREEEGNRKKVGESGEEHEKVSTVSSENRFRKPKAVCLPNQKSMYSSKDVLHRESRAYGPATPIL